jgi:putative transposase
MMHITKTDIQWRMLPKDFGPWQTVYFYFRKLKFEGVFEELMHVLRNAVRKIKENEVSLAVRVGCRKVK